MTIGIPYAPADVDGEGYFVTCPTCGAVCRGVDEAQDTAEDAVTKGANTMYAQHYAERHGVSTACRRCKTEEANKEGFCWDCYDDMAGDREPPERDDYDHDDE